MSTLQVASRLVELNLQIRAEFRGPLPSSGVQPQETDSEEDISRPVKNSGPFAAPAATQLPPQLQPSSESLAPPAPAASVEADHHPMDLPDLSMDTHESGDAGPGESPLTFAELPSDGDFFKTGLGQDDAMIFQKDFQDRVLVQKVLLGGQSELKLSRIVDLYHHVESADGKRRKVRPGQAQAWTAFMVTCCGRFFIQPQA